VFLRGEWAVGTLPAPCAVRGGIGSHHFVNAASPPTVLPPEVGRNSQCPCGSGKKYKRCCGMK